MENSDQSGIDRLSNLPEHIILHILSFSPTETVAATSVLSKRWQFLWTLIPNLDFDASRSHRTTVISSFSNSHSFRGYKEYRSFASYVTRVLFLRRERFIQRFRLKCHEPFDPSDLDLWVSYAIAHNVQELDLDLSYEYNSRDTFSFHFTQQSCKTLVVLKLKSVLILDNVSFPVLKILHLKKSKFEHREAKFLPSGFPVLEELIISRSIDTNFEFYLPELRFLAINLPRDCGLVRMDCPALTQLLVIDNYSRELNLENLLSLVEADIENNRSPRTSVNEDESYGRYVMNVVKSLSNVSSLRLTLPTMMNEIELGFFRGDDFPFFHNLVQVELALKSCSREIVILILRKFKNLECLTLCYEGKGDDWEGFSQRNGRRRVYVKELNQRTRVPNCLTSHLTTFCFRNFRGRNDEMKVTRYILKNSLLLKNMRILFPSWLGKDGIRIRRTLRKSPRGSKRCQLEFVHLQSPESDSDRDSDSDNDNDST